MNKILQYRKSYSENQVCHTTYDESDEGPMQKPTFDLLIVLLRWVNKIQGYLNVKMTITKILLGRITVK